MDLLIKLLKWVAAGLALIILAVVLFVYVPGERTFDAPYPDLAASQDSAIIARGKYLAFGAAHCVSCHAPMDKFEELENGLQMPLMGGWELDIPPGSFRAPNLTPDMETGIGKFTDGELARALRYSVKHDGKPLFPFMPFQEISDEDLVAIISFLRSQEPVKTNIQPSEYSFLGRALYAFGVVKPEAPRNTPPNWVNIDSTVEYGNYIANNVGNCYGCHTARSLKTGEFYGKPFAGGLLFPEDPLSHGYSFVSPNLTPHKTDGVIALWDESTFVNRFRAGRTRVGSPMPWGAFSRLDEMELKALYRYLQSIEAVPGKVEKTVYASGETLPG